MQLAVSIYRGISAAIPAPQVISSTLSPTQGLESSHRHRSKLYTNRNCVAEIDARASLRDFSSSVRLPELRSIMASLMPPFAATRNTMNGRRSKLVISAAVASMGGRRSAHGTRWVIPGQKPIAPNFRHCHDQAACAFKFNRDRL